MGKGGYKSPLAQHVVWLQGYVKKRPIYFYPKVIAAFKTERKLVVNYKSVRACLRRHGIRNPAGCVE